MSSSSYASDSGSYASASYGSYSNNDGNIRDRDYLIAVDTSKSMKKEDVSWKDEKGAVDTITRQVAAANFAESMCNYILENGLDPDGVSLWKFSKKAEQILENADGKEVRKEIRKLKRSSGTRIGNLVRKTLKWHFDKELKRPSTLIIITDGAPSKGRKGKKEVEDAIIDAMKRAKNHMEVAITFIQVGDSDGAREWLEELDDKLDRKVKKSRDLVDTMNVDEVTRLGLDQVLKRAVHD